LSTGPVYRREAPALGDDVPLIPWAKRKRSEDDSGLMVDLFVNLEIMPVWGPNCLRGRMLRL
jgi:hypothetical protein